MVAFDLDGTLVDQADAASRWAEEFISSNRLNLDVVDVAAALTARRPKGEVFAELVESYDLNLDADELWANYRRRMPELVTCTDADRNALIELRAAGWTLGIVTNGMVDNQQGKIRSLGLDALVDGWVISAEVGVRKPLEGDLPRLGVTPWVSVGRLDGRRQPRTRYCWRPGRRTPHGARYVRAGRCQRMYGESCRRIGCRRCCADPRPQVTRGAAAISAPPDGHVKRCR